SPINTGDTAGFVVTITDVNDTTHKGDAYGVTLNDPLPTGLTWSIDTTNSSSGFSFTTILGVQHLVYGSPTTTLTSGSSVHVHVTALTAAANCGTLTNTATVSATNEGSGDTGNDTATASIVVNCPDVDIVKVADGSPAALG